VEKDRQDYIEYVGGNLEIYKDWVPEEEAKRLGYDEFPLNLDDSVIARYWDIKDYDNSTPICNYLSEYTSVKSPDKQQFVDDPMVDGIVQPGRWRHVKTYTRDGQNSEKWPCQILKKGYIETLLSGDDVIWEYPNRAISVQFRNLRPEACESIINELSESTYTIPEIYGEEYSGEWHNIYSEIGKDDDGSPYIVINLARPTYALEAYQSAGTPNAKNVYYFWSVPKDAAQGVISAFSGNTEATASLSYSPSSELVNIVISHGDTGASITTGFIQVVDDCRYKVEHSFVYGQESQPSLSSYEKNPEDGVTYSIKSVYFDLNVKRICFYKRGVAWR